MDPVTESPAEGNAQEEDGLRKGQWSEVGVDVQGEKAESGSWEYTQVAKTRDYSHLLTRATSRDRSSDVDVPTQTEASSARWLSLRGANAWYFDGSCWNLSRQGRDCTLLLALAPLN
jgi:hypothetical protein